MPILYNLITATNGKPRYSKLEFCHACGSQDIILNSKPVGRNSSRSKNGIWQCTECDASVAAHSDGNPQGYMADANVRKLRYDFHAVMNQLLEQRYTYDNICLYLQTRLNIDPEHLHSAWLTKGELVMAIKAMEERAKRPYRNRPFKTEIRRKASSSKNDTRNAKKRHTKEGYFNAG